MCFDVAPGFNFKIGHFWHLNHCGERKSYSLLYNTIQNTMGKVWFAGVQRYLLNLSYKRMLRHRSALKKKINLSFIEKKKNELRSRRYYED